MKRNNKKGFTIVELVIVIAVIAILSAVLIPTFGSVIDDANEVTAKQECRNTYTQLYAEDLADGIVDGKVNSGKNNAADLTKPDGCTYSVNDTTGVVTVTLDNSHGWKVTFDGTNYTTEKVTGQ